ncbi:helix-turn-helix domain-containing protein [Shouchella shacheensis]|uniref:helix-turn-helix domain-containing protein n=1 Tax=Shouchella shacheensis TaxID=1649580 RepID=UPI00073FCAF9|nr:helix-turn-helix domain-containing protein [Shouchella shacheensis]
MNYIAEMNALHVRQETDPRSPKATVLWYALMDVCNKTGWMKQFSVAAAVLCFKTGLTEDQVFKARRELVKKGYITFYSRRGKAAVYEIHSLLTDYSTTPQENSSEV